MEEPFAPPVETVVSAIIVLPDEMREREIVFAHRRFVREDDSDADDGFNRRV